MIRDTLRKWLGITDPVPPTPPARLEMSGSALAYLVGDDGAPASPFVLPTLAPGVHPRADGEGVLAQDMMPSTDRKSVV